MSKNITSSNEDEFFEKLKCQILTPPNYYKDIDSLIILGGARPGEAIHEKFDEYRIIAPGFLIYIQIGFSKGPELFKSYGKWKCIDSAHMMGYGVFVNVYIFIPKNGIHHKYLGIDFYISPEPRRLDGFRIYVGTKINWQGRNPAMNITHLIHSNFDGQKHLPYIDFIEPNIPTNTDRAKDLAEVWAKAVENYINTGTSIDNYVNQEVSTTEN